MQEGDDIQVLLFEVGGVRYGLRAVDVCGIHRAVSIVPVPGAPAVVEGIVDVRGEVVPALDVRARFGHPPAPLSPQEHLIIAQAGPRLVALRADHATAVRAIPRQSITDAPKLASSAGHLAGVARLPDGLVLIHDFERFLSQAETERLDVALAGGEER